MIIDIVPADEFIAMAEALIAPPFRPKFRAVTWRDLGKGAEPHKYIVKGLLVENEKSVLAGESQSGKSFLATDLAMSLARGCAFQGNRIPEARGVVYVAAESGSGVVHLRIPAYRKHFDLEGPDIDLPLVFVTQSPDLFSSDDDVKALIADIKGHSKSWSVPLGLVIIDTFSASTPGADENKSADMSKVLQRVDMIREQCGCHVMIVHHMNAEGSKVRGHTSMVANMDAVLVVAKTEEHDRPEPDETGKVGRGRQIRTMTIGKQKDGEQGRLRKFVLKVVDLGRDEDGDPVTSCVCDLPENMSDADLTTKWREPGMYRLPAGKKNADIGFKALKEALKRQGTSAPKHIDRAPAGVDVITVGAWQKEWESLASEGESGEEDLRKLSARVKGQRDRLIELLLRENIIMKQGEWVWRTKRRVQGHDAPLRGLNGGQDYDRSAASAGLVPAPPSPDLLIPDDLPFA